MAAFLCSEFLDFAACRFGPRLDLRDVPACDDGPCAGPGHVRAWAEMVSGRIGVPAATLLRGFGCALFGRLLRGYPAFFVGIDSTPELLLRFESAFAAELRKLAPGVGLGTLGVTAAAGRAIEVDYRSPDGLADVAMGLLDGAIAHFGEPLVVERAEPADATGRRARLRVRPRTSLTARVRSGGRGDGSGGVVPDRRAAKGGVE